MKDGRGSALSGLGMIGTLIVLAIVLLLAARAWQSMAPAALDVTSAAPADVEATAGPDGVPSPGHLPDLDEMRQTTATHTQDVQDALRQIDGDPAAGSRPH
ncbi:MAG: hypothetical protein ACE5IK_11410 [Acidobacteriota bacterium]